jgi:hypothetical protein
MRRHHHLNACHAGQGLQRHLGGLMRRGQSPRRIRTWRFDHESHKTALYRQRTNQIVTHQISAAGG